MQKGDFIKSHLPNGGSTKYEGVYVGNGRPGTIKVQLVFYLDGEPLDLDATSAEVIPDDALDPATQEKADLAREKFHLPKRRNRR